MFSSEEPPVLVCPAKVQSVDDFVPDERLDKSFLEDSLPSKTKVPQPAAAPTVDSDRWKFSQILLTWPVSTFRKYSLSMFYILPSLFDI